jgi:tRNA G18 (ribose-2'-O)-methylase SpoU
MPRDETEMTVFRVEDPRDPRLVDYARVREPVLLRERGVFIAESREVVRILLDETEIAVRSLLVTEAAATAFAPALERRGQDIPVYVGDRALMKRLVGYDIHRGCLAAAERPAPVAVETLLPATTLLVLESVSNPDNVGGAFRNALAFGASGIVLGPGCADPYYRKTIRTSMAAVLRLPHAVARDWPGSLERMRAAGLTVLALTPRADAVDLAEVRAAGPMAVLVGNEGAGLSDAALAAADVAARVPIADNVDSLNVATTAGIALYALSHR